MKRSLQAFSLVLSLFIVSCHKEAKTTADEVATIANADQTDGSLRLNQRGGDIGGSSAGVTFECTSCVMTYPNNDNLPRSGAVFSESDVLVSSDPGVATCGIAPDEIKVWYSDEHAITLGVRQVNVIKKSGSQTVTTTTNYNVTPSPAVAALVLNPSVGTTIQTGDQTGNDVSLDGGRPLWPALFITDITNDHDSKAGDWQYGGKAVPPTKIAGTWKSVVRTIDKTKTPNVVTITPDTDPKKNNWNLAGGDAPLGKQSSSEGYTAEVAWNVQSLHLIPGHAYRLQFMVHDGDQNKVGGDVGEACTTIIIPGGNHFADKK